MGEASRLALECPGDVEPLRTGPFAQVRRGLLDLDARVASATEAEDAATRERDEAQQVETSEVDAAARLAAELEALLAAHQTD